MKKVIFVSIIIILLLLVILILYTNDMQMNECLELRVPKLTKREVCELQDSDLFNDEEVIKIYVSKNQEKKYDKKLKRMKIGKTQNFLMRHLSLLRQT